MNKSIRKIARTLKHEITFMKNVSDNDIEEQWKEVCKVFASIAPINENNFMTLEHLNFSHVITESLFLLRTRFIKNLHTKMRIIFKDRVFEIKRIVNLAEQDRILQIIALEI